MAKLTKKAKALQGKVDSLKLYAFDDAIAMVKEAATAKFDESIDVAVQLGVDAKKSDQVVRGAVVLFKTSRTSVWLFNSVSSKMHFNTCFVGKLFATNCTSVWLLTSVNS